MYALIKTQPDSSTDCWDERQHVNRYTNGPLACIRKMSLFVSIHYSISHPVKWGYMRCRNLNTHYCRHYDIDTQREWTYEHSAIRFITGSSYKRKGWVQLISTYIFDIVNCMSLIPVLLAHNTTSIIQRCIYLCHYNILLSLITTWIIFFMSLWVNNSGVMI